MNFFQVITAAIRDMEEHGFDSVERVRGWVIRLRRAAIESLIPEHKMVEELAKLLTNDYKNLIDFEKILKLHQKIDRFTIARVRPQLRAELDRRISASAELIKINREEMIERTIRRFSGWSTSIPIGGSKTVEVKEVKEQMRKALVDLPFTERRVMIDQSHKLTSSLNQILATDGGAIAAIWHSHWRQSNYNYRKDHKERDGNVYAIRDSWAIKKGLMKAGSVGYTDEITQPGEEVYCRCNYQYLYNLRDLPKEMITQKGFQELERVRSA